jgi:hypothetical protein
MRFMPHRCKPHPVNVYHYEPSPDRPALPVTAILMRCGRCGRIETEVHAGTWDMMQLRGWTTLGVTEGGAVTDESGHPELEPFDELPACLADALVTASRSGLPAADVVDQLRRRIADELTVHWPGFDLGTWMRQSFPDGKLPGEPAPYTETVPPLPADAGGGILWFAPSPAGSVTSAHPGNGPRPAMILRDLTRAEYPGLSGDITAGTKMWTYSGPTYGCLGPGEVPLTREENGDEFEGIPSTAMALLVGYDSEPG